MTGKVGGAAGRQTDSALDMRDFYQLVSPRPTPIQQKQLMKDGPTAVGRCEKRLRKIQALAGLSVREVVVAGAGSNPAL